MPWDTIAVGVVGVLAFGGLIVAARRGAGARVGAGLALVASAALVYVLVGRAAALIFFAVDALLVLLTWRLAGSRYSVVWIAVLVGLLGAAKLPPVQRMLAAGAANPFGLGPGLWIGVSYLIFRLIHVTIDAHKGRIEAIPLDGLAVYALHPASLVAGPIDRIQNSLAAQADRLTTDDVQQGLWRVFRGVVVKVVVANPLYIFVAAHDMARDPDRPVWMAWAWLLAYTFYLLADFASYSDIAIGFGRLAGLRLPENFERPYLAPSLTVFWQRWHITLSAWARDYVFFPVARNLRTRLDPRRRNLAQFAAHMATMLAIGLWHGLTPAFAVWGVYHGLGMFAVSQLGWFRRQGEGMGRALRVGATFAFVMFGWVFFAADLPTAVRIFARLFGIG
jgi:alginate O-acetyltransferase complex protein AlgI